MLLKKMMMKIAFSMEIIPIWRFVLQSLDEWKEKILYVSQDTRIVGRKWNDCNLLLKLL